MAVQIKTFSKRSGNFRKLAEEFQREVLESMAHKAVEVSPVDTSAYVDSFGFNSPQGFSSKDRPTGQNEGASKARNKQRLSQEVASVSLEGSVVFGNGAPHAGAVENRPVKKAPTGYKVFAQTRREFTRLAREALMKVKNK